MPSLKTLHKSPTISTWSSLVVQLMNNLVLLPIVLYKFEAADIALWLLFSSILALSLLVDFGFGPVVIKEVSTLFSKGTSQNGPAVEEKSIRLDDSLKTFLGTVNIIYWSLGLLVIVVLATAGYLAVSNLIELSTNLEAHRLAYYLMIGRIFFLIQGINLTSILHGFNMLYFTKWTDSIINILRLTLSVMLLLMGYGILELIALDLLCSFVFIVFLRVRLVKLFDRYSLNILGFIRWHSALFKRIWYISYRWGIWKLSSVAINYGNNLIVSQLPNPSVVSGYLLTNRILTFARVLSTAPVFSNINFMFGLVSKNELVQLRKFLLPKLQLGLLIMITGSLLLALSGNYLLALFSFQTSLLAPAAILLMGLAGTLEYHHGCHAQIYMGTNHIPFLFPGLLSALTILAVNGFFSIERGVIYIIITQLVVQLAFNNWFPVYLNLKFLKWPGKDFVLSLFDFRSLLHRKNMISI